MRAHSRKRASRASAAASGCQPHSSNTRTRARRAVTPVRAMTPRARSARSVIAVTRENVGRGPGRAGPAAGGLEDALIGSYMLSVIPAFIAGTHRSIGAGVSGWMVPVTPADAGVGKHRD